MYKFGWFSTGRGKGSRDLLEIACNAIQEGEIKAKIDFVFCSREPGEFVESDKFIALVNNYKIPLVTYSYQKFKAGKDDAGHKDSLPQWRLEYDRNVMERLKHFQPNLCILAGYMLIVGKEMCTRYDMVNLHPAAPDGPTGTWREVIWQLVKNKATETGVMMHLVTPELDKGPVVSYCTFPIRGTEFDSYWQDLKGQDIEELKNLQGEDYPLFKLIRQHGLKREFPLILATMKTFSQGRVEIIDGKAVDPNGIMLTGYNLTNEMDNLIR
jgi:folate-dependent phosphoribosylglycinamide formyltransferase PurN